MIKDLVTFYPPFTNKCGPQIIGAAILGIAGLASAGISAASNSANVSAATDLNAENRNWQHDEAELSRQRASEEWDRQHAINKQDWQDQYNTQMQGAQQLMQKQADIQQEQWQKQFDIQNTYNSPAAQIQRMSEAGLNGAALAGSSGQSGMASSSPSVSMPSPSAPAPGINPSELLSVAAGNPVTTTPQHKVDWAVQVIDSLSSAAEKLTKSGVNTVEYKRNIATLNEFVKQEILKTENLDLINQAQKINNYVAEHSKQANIKKAWNEVEHLASQIAVNNALKENYDSSTDLNKMNTKVAEMLSNKYFNENEILKMQVSTFMEDFNNKQRLVKAQTATEYTVQGVNRATAENIQLRSEEQRIVNFFAGDREVAAILNNKQNTAFQRQQELVAAVERKLKEVNYEVAKLGLPKAELEALRAQGIIEERNGVYVFRQTDNVMSWLGTLVNVALAGALK